MEYGCIHLQYSNVHIDDPVDGRVIIIRSLNLRNDVEKLVGICGFHASHLGFSVYGATE